MTTRLILHIDRLVLHGIDRAAAPAIAEQLQAELQRRLAEPGAAERLAAGGHRARLRLGPLAPSRESGGHPSGYPFGQVIAGGLLGEGEP